MRKLLLALALLALAGSAWALDTIGGNTWEKAGYSRYGRLLFTAVAQDSTVYLFQGNSDTVTCSADSQRWSYIVGQRLPTTTGQLYSTSKLRRIQHIELWPSGSNLDIQLTTFSFGQALSQRVYLDTFLPGRTIILTCDSLRVRVISSNGGFTVNYTIW